MRVVNSLPQRQPAVFQPLNILVTGVTTPAFIAAVYLRAFPFSLG